MPSQATYLIDGYNVIFAWDELAALMAHGDVEAARNKLIGSLSQYRAIMGIDLIVVFDSRGSDIHGEKRTLVDGVVVIFGNRNVSADMVIERMIHDMRDKGRAEEYVVVTSDMLERSMVTGMGAQSISSPTFIKELVKISGEIASKQEKYFTEHSAPVRLEMMVDPEQRRELERLRDGDYGKEGEDT